MADFNKALPKLLRVEGGFADSPSDRGGMTFMGISRKHHPDWEGWSVIDQYLRAGEDPDTLRQNPFMLRVVATFYRAKFWDLLRLDLIEDQAIAEELFDSAVNCAPTRAARWLQQAMNMLSPSDLLLVDGVIGPKTLTKVNTRVRNYGNVNLLKFLNGKQFRHYDELCERDPSQTANFKGWLRRVWETGGTVA